MEQEAENAILAQLDAGDLRSAATQVIRAYGGEIYRYLRAILRDEVTADEVFSDFGEDLWRGIAGFRRDGAIRSWAYKVAWNAARRRHRDPFHKRGRALGDDEAQAVVAEVRASTQLYLRTEVKDGLTEIREDLDPEEQTLLILRVDRELPWRDIADVLSTGSAPVAEAALWKRFERLKKKIRERLAARGLLGG